MLPILVINPRGDRAFVELAERLVLDGVQTPEELQARLREVYPRAVARLREITNEGYVVWYVYRDGRWISQ